MFLEDFISLVLLTTPLIFTYFSFKISRVELSVLILLITPTNQEPYSERRTCCEGYLICFLFLCHFSGFSLLSPIFLLFFSYLNPGGVVDVFLPPILKCPDYNFFWKLLKKLLRYSQSVSNASTNLTLSVVFGSMSKINLPP